MPELPEVQTIVDELNGAEIIGRRISSVHVLWPRTVSGLAPEFFSQSLRGRTIAAVSRRAKYIRMDLRPNGHLIIHLRMSGHLCLAPAVEAFGKHQHLILGLTGELSLRLHDPRKFGRAYLVEDPAVILGDLGPEPLAPRFTAKKLQRALWGCNRQLKPLLLDQRFIAGLGNIYVDETLWEARLNPLCKSASLTKTQIKRLHRAIRKVLRRGLKNGGTSLGRGRSNFRSLRKRGRNSRELRVFRRTGAPCARCATLIERIIVGQRATHICPACQRLETSVT
jgi:formamidopyrimidine-DNA glycosylase